MKPNYDHHLSKDRRLVVLRVLANSPGYSANEFSIEAVLEDLGHHISNDLFRGELAWLLEQQLISTSQVGGVTIAKITQRGLDIARGKAHHPGVQRPRPE